MANAIPTPTSFPIQFGQRDAKVIESATLAAGTISNKTIDSSNTISGASITATSAALTTPVINSVVSGQASVTLTAAQFIAATSAVDLIAAPGTGKVNIIENVQVKLAYGSAAFTSGSDFKVLYAAGGDVVLFDSTTVTGSANQSYFAIPTIYALDNSTGTAKGFDATAAANQKVQLLVTGSAFATGTGCTVTVKINYKTITL